MNPLTISDFIVYALCREELHSCKCLYPLCHCVYWYHCSCFLFLWAIKYKGRTAIFPAWMTWFLFQGNTLLTRQVLPESTILANMTGHASWQTFVNNLDQPAESRKTPPKSSSYTAELEVRLTNVYFWLHLAIRLKYTCKDSTTWYYISTCMCVREQKIYHTPNNVQIVLVQICLFGSWKDR